MHGGRGAKGSVNDRIISFLFRKRYLEYLKKKESYTVEEREKAIQYLKKIKELDIENDVSMLEDEDRHILEDELNSFNLDDIAISNSSPTSHIVDIANNSQDISLDNLDALKTAGKKISEYDPATELYNFDEYDYYEAITQSTGLSKEDEYGILDVDKEITKREDEKTILEEVKEFIDKSKEKLDEMKSEIEFIKSEIEKQYTQEQIDELKSRYDKLNEKIRLLKKQYDIIKEKYEFEGYEILDNLTLIESVDDFKTKADLEELELMVDACKYEVEAIDSIVIEEEKSRGVGADISGKKEELKDRDIALSDSKRKSHRIYNLNETIEREIAIQAQLLESLRVHLNTIETDAVQVNRMVLNTGGLFRSFLRITAGILTAPLSNMFGTLLGVHLVRSGLHELRNNLIPQEVQRTEYIDRYRSIEREIRNAQDDVSRSLIMINDTLENVEEIKKVYKQKFEKYADKLPEISNLWKDINLLEKRLNNCKQRVQDYQETLEENQRQNTQRVYNANHTRMHP